MVLPPGCFSWSHIHKCADVHKSLSIKLCFPTPTPLKSVNFEDFLLICTVLPHFGRFSRGGTKFCGQELYGHPDSSETSPEVGDSSYPADPEHDAEPLLGDPVALRRADTQAPTR